MCRLEQDNGHGVVQNGFSKDQSIELWLHFVCVKDGKNGNWVGGGEGSADRHGLDEVDLEAIERKSCPEEEDDAEDKG